MKTQNPASRQGSGGHRFPANSTARITATADIGQGVEQIEFLAAHEPDHRIEAQPYWRIGRQHGLGLNGPVIFDVFVSLCARCAAPFITLSPEPLETLRYLNRRCPAHRRPGRRVRTFRPTWRVDDGGAA